MFKASALRVADPTSVPVFRDCLGSSHTSDLRIGIPVATCQALDVVGSVLEMVGSVSVYGDLVR